MLYLTFSTELSWLSILGPFPSVLSSEHQIRAPAYVTDLAPHHVLSRKYVQNTTVSDVIPKGTDFRGKTSNFALTKVYLYI